MGADRIIITVKQAVDSLPDKETLITFIDTGEKRVWAPWKREHIINLLSSFGKEGVDVSGEIALRNGFGVCVFWRAGWLFIETKPGFCPRCQGSKHIARDKWDVILPSKRCPVCKGAGFIEPIGQKEKAGEADLIDDTKIAVAPR